MKKMELVKETYRLYTKLGVEEMFEIGQEKKNTKKDILEKYNNAIAELKK